MGFSLRRIVESICIADIRADMARSVEIRNPNNIFTGECAPPTELDQFSCFHVLICRHMYSHVFLALISITF